MNPALTKLADVYVMLNKSLRDLVEIEKLLTNTGLNDIQPTCLDCAHWGKGVCDEFKQVPPPEVIARPLGKCDKIDYIPF